MPRILHEDRVHLVPPQCWYTLITSVLPEFKAAALELEQQGCTMRFRKSLPLELPKRAWLRECRHLPPLL